MTRRNRSLGGLDWIGDVSLVLIDEVHLLSDPRGAALEAVICRIKMVSKYPEMRGYPISKLRIVAVSATIPNIEDIAAWLGATGMGVRKSVPASSLSLPLALLPVVHGLVLSRML